MSADKVFGTYYPQAGDSFDQLLARIAGAIVRPWENEVIYLASAARLGTTTGAIIDTRGAKGIMISAYATSFLGVGNLSIQVNTNSNILMPSANSRVVVTAATTASQQIMIAPGQSPAGPGVTVIQVGSSLSRFTQISLINASAVGGNEVTCEVSYYLL
mgnify:CR=1 FL=1